MEIVIFCILIGLIPAVIAHSKGGFFLGWWLYGTLLFIVALIHALIMRPDRTEVDRRALPWAKARSARPAPRW